MSDDTKPEDGIVQFVSDSSPESETHEECEEGSPCKSGEPIPVMGIRAYVHEGETYLHRSDILSVLARVMESYHQAYHATERDEYGVGMSVVNLLGSQISAMTTPDRAISLEVPDTIPTDWLTEQEKPTMASYLERHRPKQEAPESPIERAIRLAKEAAIAKKDEQDVAALGDTDGDA